MGHEPCNRAISEDIFAEIVSCLACSSIAVWKGLERY